MGSQQEACNGRRALQRRNSPKQVPLLWLECQIPMSNPRCLVHKLWRWLLQGWKFPHKNNTNWRNAIVVFSPWDPTDWTGLLRMPLCWALCHLCPLLTKTTNCRSTTIAWMWAPCIDLIWPGGNCMMVGGGRIVLQTMSRVWRPVHMPDKVIVTIFALQVPR